MLAALSASKHIYALLRMFGIPSVLLSSRHQLTALTWPLHPLSRCFLQCIQLPSSLGHSSHLRPFRPLARLSLPMIFGKVASCALRSLSFLWWDISTVVVAKTLCPSPSSPALHYRSSYPAMTQRFAHHTTHLCPAIVQYSSLEEINW